MARVFARGIARDSKSSSVRIEMAKFSREVSALTRKHWRDFAGQVDWKQENLASFTGPTEVIVGEVLLCMPLLCAKCCNWLIHRDFEEPRVPVFTAFPQFLWKSKRGGGGSGQRA